jgi:hypothetical protein
MLQLFFRRRIRPSRWILDLVDMVKAQVKTGPQVKPKRVRKSDLEKEVAMLEIEHVRALFFFGAHIRAHGTNIPCVPAL